MREWWRSLWQRSRQTGLLMVGVPDYRTYLQHMETHHPGHPVLTERQWIERAQQARFGGAKIGKCPC